MNNKSTMLRMKRNSHNLRIVMSVFYWGAIALAAGSLVAAIVMKLLPDYKFLLDVKSIGHLGFSLDGLLKYDINDPALEGISMKNIYIGIAIMTALISILMIPVLRQLVLILKTVEGDEPFATDNAKRVFIIGNMFILGSFIIPASEVIVARAMIHTLKMQNISTNYSINIVLILTGFMMFILSGIFKYGSYLQQEYDETV